MNKNNKANDKYGCPDNKHTHGQDVSKDDVQPNDAVPRAVAEIGHFFLSMNERLTRLDRQLSKVLDARKGDLETIETCVETTADCQKYTAELANHILERYALHPSIVAVDLLAGRILQMSRQADALMKNPQTDSSLMPLSHSLLDAAKIAELKMDQLDIEHIQPEELDAVDSERHEIVTAVATHDKDKHKKVHETLSAGLIYHNKILRRARVSVYRFSEQRGAEQENRQPESQ